MKEKNLKTNVIISTFYQILTMIIPFITAPYISRVIGAKGIGIYSYTLSIETYFSMFAALGTLTYGTREIARNRNNKYLISKLFFEIELLTVITSLISIGIWLVFVMNVKQYKIYFIILTINLLSTLFDISWFFNGLEQFKFTVIQNSVFKILGIILLFIFVKEPNDLSLYIGIMSITTLLGNFSMWIYLPKFIMKVNIKNLKIIKHFKETFIYFIPTIATSIYTVLDKTLIGNITKNANENGYYEQATKIINITKAITFSSINSVLGSRISYLFSQKKYEEIKNRINNSINYIFFIGIGALFGLLSISNEFVLIFFGDGYEKVSLLINLLSPLIIIIGISNCLGSQYYNPAGLRSKSAKFIIFGSVINLILNLCLIPKYLSVGASIATVISELIISFLYLKNCNGYLKCGEIIRFSYKKFFSGLIMFFIINLFKYININSYILLFLQIVVGVLTYIIILFILKDDFVISFYNNQIKPRIKEKSNGIN